MQNKNRNISYQSYILLSKESKDLLSQYVTENMVPKEKRNGPILFIGTRYFYGYDEIEEGLSEVEEDYL